MKCVWEKVVTFLVLPQFSIVQNHTCLNLQKFKLQDNETVIFLMSIYIRKHIVFIN